MHLMFYMKELRHLVISVQTSFPLMLGVFEGMPEMGALVKSLGLSFSICRMRNCRPTVPGSALKCDKDYADSTRKIMIPIWDAPSS